MPVIRSAGAVIFRETKNGVEYLILHYPPMPAGRTVTSADGHWDFPKGEIEKGEKTEEAVRREVVEETGITDIKIIPGFKETIRYFVKYGEERQLKFVAFFLAETAQRKVKISWEHLGHTWLPYEEAYKRVTYTNAKNVLKKAHNFLR